MALQQCNSCHGGHPRPTCHPQYHRSMDPTWANGFQPLCMHTRFWYSSLLLYLNLHVHLYISISPCLSPFYLQLSSSLSAFSSVSFRFFSLFPSFFPLSCLFFSFSNYHCMCLSALICVGMPPGTPSKNTMVQFQLPTRNVKLHLPPLASHESPKKLAWRPSLCQPWK